MIEWYKNNTCRCFNDRYVVCVDKLTYGNVFAYRKSQEDIEGLAGCRGCSWYVGWFGIIIIKCLTNSHGRPYFSAPCNLQQHLSFHMLILFYCHDKRLSGICSHYLPIFFPQIVTDVTVWSVFLFIMWPKSSDYNCLLFVLSCLLYEEHSNQNELIR